MTRQSVEVKLSRLRQEYPGAKSIRRTRIKQEAAALRAQWRALRAAERAA